MQESNVEPNAASLSFWVGIDWGDARSIGAVVDQLLTLVNGQVESLRLGIETSTGPLVEALLARGLAVQLSRLQDELAQQPRLEQLTGDSARDLSGRRALEEWQSKQRTASQPSAQHVSVLIGKPRAAFALPL